MRIQRTVFLAAGALAAALWMMQPAAGQKEDQAEVLLRAALKKELVDGDLKAAIEQYKKIVSSYSGNRSVVAKALLAIGQCYEKLGDAEARKAYEQLVRDYADQGKIVAEARTRLAAMAPSATVSRNSMAVRQIWAGPDVDASGTPTPDGRFLTFVDWSTGDVAVRNLATKETRRLTNKGSWAASYEYGMSSIVSPDGKQIAYAWAIPTLSIYELRTLPMTATAEVSPSRVLYRNDDVMYLQPFAWSADGKQILTLLKRRDSTNQIALISVADGSTRILKSLDWRYPSKMSFSPDGRYIAYDAPVRGDSPDRDIFVLSVDGRQEVPLVQDPAIDHAPVWTPDGKRILFASDRRGSTGLWAIQVAEGKPQGTPELLKPDMGAVSALGFSRDGSYYYGVWMGTQDVYTAELSPQTGDLLSAPTRLTERFLGSNLGGASSPDGRRFAYFSRRGPLNHGPGSMAVVIRSGETGEEREFFSKLEFSSNSPAVRWFPNGRSLLVATTGNQGRWSLQRLDAQTGTVTPIREGLIADADLGLLPCISPDGRTLYYFRSANSPEPWSIVAYDIEAGRERELFRSTSRKRVLSLALSRDGKRLAFIDGDVGGSLHVMPADGGEPREIFRAPAEQAGDALDGRFGIEWTQDDRFILFVMRHLGAEGGVDLWRISPDGSAPQKVLSMGGELGFPNVHPDGRRLAFTAGTQYRWEVWVVQNFLPEPPASR